MRKILLAAAIVALVAAGCGSDDGAGDSARPTTSTSASPGPGTGGTVPVQLEGKANDHRTKELGADEQELEMEADDFYFGPTFVTAAPGQKVTVKVKNEGDASHTFTIDGLGVDQEVRPGESADIDVTLPASGTVPFNCRFHKARACRAPSPWQPLAEHRSASKRSWRGWAPPRTLGSGSIHPPSTPEISAADPPAAAVGGHDGRVLAEGRPDVVLSIRLHQRQAALLGGLGLLTLVVLVAGLVDYVSEDLRLARFPFAAVMLAPLYLPALSVRLRLSLTREAHLTVGSEALTVVHPGLLRRPLCIDRAQVHSVMPLWLRPPPPDRRGSPANSSQGLQRSLVEPGGRVPAVRPSLAVPLLGEPGGKSKLVLGVVLAGARPIPEARSLLAWGSVGSWGWRPIPCRRRPLRGLLIGVDDLDAAQRALLPWGVVRPLADDAKSWLQPGRGPREPPR